MMVLRRHLLALPLALLATGCANLAPAPQLPPIVFVHGNGDTAALWQTTVWRFEIQWLAARRACMRSTCPTRWRVTTTPRRSRGAAPAAEHMAHLKAEVDKVLARTGAEQGGADRQFARRQRHSQLHPEWRRRVREPRHPGRHAQPRGVVHSRAFARPTNLPAPAPFLKGLNAPKNAAGDEVTGPVRWMTIRSDNNDKFAQPDGLWIGMAGKQTNVTFAGPELKGATNVVIPRIDHRETSFSPAAFDAAYRFITGQAPRHRHRRQRRGGAQRQGHRPGRRIRWTPKPATSATTCLARRHGSRFIATDRRPASGAGTALHRKTVGADGLWGPFTAKPWPRRYEFVVSAAGYATTHIYRSPLRPLQRHHPPAGRTHCRCRQGRQGPGHSSRPRGYFDPPRDTMRLDGQAKLPGVVAGAGVASSRLRLATAQARPVQAEFNGERLTGRVWPAQENHLVVLELTY
jgi:triacylglycerol lipase